MAEATEIEKNLQKKCHENPEYQTLWAQWTFDRRLVGQALQSVSMYFPHYSRHDESHAHKILVQISRVLGPHRIEKLGPTDLWLLLEVAYHHDLGMVVMDEAMRSRWSTKEFSDFLEDLTDSPDIEIRRAAKVFLRQEPIYNLGGAWPFDVRRALILVTAEYARKRHAGQSRKYVDDPSLIDLHSPRTELLPRRFWNLIGKICEMHGKTFAETMRLPARESGFSTDVAHPRFVACMLRLGDLLDLDDGRFCPVLARAFGGLPPSSRAHKDKHRSIDEFLVTESEIRVVAECGDPESFDATEQWLSWLRDELRDQSLSWSAISPEANFGAIPSVGQIEPHLRGYHTFADGRRPRFEVDKKAMFDFVRGAGLYDEPTACIEEILQNAVDATLLRMWRASAKQWDALKEKQSGDTIERLTTELRKYPIDVRVEAHVRNKLSKAGQKRNFWKVTIRDRGAGIGRADVEYIQRVGSSHNNPRRRERTRRMPEWMRPSGYFGIGLQSVFIFSRRIVIRSRADDDMGTIEIRMTRKTGSQEPQILVRPVTDKRALLRPGTYVQFVLSEHRIPERYSIDGTEEESGRVAESYDPILDSALPLLPSKVRDAVRLFAKGTPARIRLNVDQRLVDLPREGEESSDHEPIHLFDPKTGMDFRIQANFKDVGFDFFFKGRRTRQRFQNLFFSGSVDLYGGNASEILTVSRQKVRNDAIGKIADAIDDALLRVVPRYYDKIKNDEHRRDERRYTALAAKIGWFVKEKKTRTSHAQRAWSQLLEDESWKEIDFAEILQGDTNARGEKRTRDSSMSSTLGRAYAAAEVRIVVDPRWSNKTVGFRNPMVEASNASDEITITGDRFPEWLWEILRESPRTLVLQDATPVSGARTRTWKLTWVSILNAPADVDMVLANKDDVLRLLFERRPSFMHRTRRTIPCLRDYQALALSTGAVSKLWHVDHVLQRLRPRAIAPFKFEPDGVVSLSGAVEIVEWTYKHRQNKDVAKVDIARAMVKLATMVDAIMRDEWGKRAEYSIEETRRLLNKAYGIDGDVDA